MRWSEQDAPSGRGEGDEGGAAADLVLRGGVVRALDAAGSRAEALAVRGGRIAAVGDDATVSALIGAGTRVVELAGRAVLPGINDSHLHASWLGARWPRTVFGEADPGAAPQDPLVSNRAERREAILRAGRLLAQLGITSYTEPGIGPGEDDGDTGCFHSEAIGIYRELADRGELLQRVTLLELHGILDGPSDVETVLAGIRSRAAAAPEADPAWFAIPGVKIFGDLIPLTRQAWTARSYDDGGHGDLLVRGDTLEQRAERLAEMLRAAHAAGLQVGLHATGDRTIGLALDAFAAAAAEPGAPSVRELGHVVIHGDLATPEQLRRMGDLGVWLNAQPGIAARTGEWLASRMGEGVAAEAWDYGAALDAGVLVLSSDAPVLDFDWRRGVADADARVLASGGADAGDADARLLALLRAYTAVPAEQDRAAAWKGTIEPGKVADLVVLGRDPFAVGAAGLPEVPVELTVLDGRVVFERAG
ncbi:amidohydrolase family protein [Leucobacter allii]|uniref:amidohydrolase n=1 Tax=Leucobacter allii TaxID=2932247 RepID=UPI001FD4DB1D|nr:amidohydrolase family protein [Leucobacter allii]UOR00507.1 amidohydrolase family protein [Leucobacter allii]